MTRYGKEIDGQMKTIGKLLQDGIAILNGLIDAGLELPTSAVLCVLMTMRLYALRKIGGNEIAESSTAELRSLLGEPDLPNSLREGSYLLATRLNDLFRGHDPANVGSAIEEMFIRVLRTCSVPSHADRICNAALRVFRRSRSDVAVKRAIDTGNLLPPAKC